VHYIGAIETLATHPKCLYGKY